MADPATRSKDIERALEEVVIVTSKQHLAVAADDFLRTLFPELTPDRLP